MTRRSESPEHIFERINRRRAPSAPSRDAAVFAATPPKSVTDPHPRGPSDPMPQRPPLPVEPATETLRVDEILFDGHSDRAGTTAPGSQTSDKDTFPRSATMRLLLNHPTLTLGVSLPAAVLLLRSPATRRLLLIALQAGALPGARGLIASLRDRPDRIPRG